MNNQNKVKLEEKAEEKGKNEKRMKKITQQHKMKKKNKYNSLCI